MKRDHISNLPKPILHAILSKLPEKEAARTSILSKSWEETWSTFPMLSFSDTKFIGSSFQPQEDFVRKAQIFLNYVKRILLGFRNQGLTIREFNLSMSMSCLDPSYISKDVDLWMKLASETGVEALEFFLSDHDREEDEEEGWDYCYALPMDVFEAKALTKLVLIGKLRVDIALMNHSNKFFKLKVLSLWDVLLGDEQIKHFLTSCPLIEYITLRRCHIVYTEASGYPYELSTSLMKSLSLCGLPKLKGVDIEGIHEVYIDAPSLENLSYNPGTLHEPYMLNSNDPFKLNSNGCRNLKVLCLRFLSNVITDNWFFELFANFRFLESLKLDNCSLVERINISSIQLKVLTLYYCSGLKEVNIDAPNLSSCRHIGDGAAKPVICFLRSSPQLEVKVQIYAYDIDHCNLREFIQNIKPQNVLASVALYIESLHVDPLNPTVFQVSSLPPSIKHLEIGQGPRNKASFLPFFNTLLSSCCPATISMTFLPDFNSKAFIKFFYETIKGGKEDECFCSTSDAKCWWHDLKDVKVSSSIKFDGNVDFKTILDAMPNGRYPLPLETIRFSLEF